MRLHRNGPTDNLEARPHESGIPSHAHDEPRQLRPSGKRGLVPHVGGVSRRVARLSVAPATMRTNNQGFILKGSSYNMHIPSYLVLYMQTPAGPALGRRGVERSALPGTAHQEISALPRAPRPVTTRKRIKHCTMAEEPRSDVLLLSGGPLDWPVGRCG